MGEEDIFPTFDSFGPLKDVAIIRDKVTGLHRGCAFVTFWNAADAERAQEALHDKFTFPGARKPAQVKPAEPSGISKSWLLKAHWMHDSLKSNAQNLFVLYNRFSYPPSRNEVVHWNAFSKGRRGGSPGALCPLWRDSGDSYDPKCRRNEQMRRFPEVHDTRISDPCH